MNDLLKQLSPSGKQQQEQANNPMARMAQFQQFANKFQNGNQAKAQVMQMLQSGQINNNQLNQAIQQARQMMPMINNFMGGRR